MFLTISYAGIFKQSMGASNRVGKVVVPARKTKKAGGIGSLESILRLLKSLIIRPLPEYPRDTLLHQKSVRCCLNRKALLIKASNLSRAARSVQQFMHWTFMYESRPCQYFIILCKSMFVPIYYFNATEL